MLKSYSWEIRSELCAVKTVDKTLLLEGTTGIPVNVAPFFVNEALNEGEELVLQFNVLGALDHCVISRKQGRHRLFFKKLKDKINEADTQVGDLLFFERVEHARNLFFVYVLSKDNQIKHAPQLTNIAVGENRASYTTTRIGHEIFREQVRLSYQYRCCLSGIEDIQPSILIASHIKPWSRSGDIEKVDRFNGLLLAPNYDKLFDKGLISFSDGGEILLSDRLPIELTERWNLKTKRLTIVPPQTKPYLAFHRDEVYL